MDHAEVGTGAHPSCDAKCEACCREVSPSGTDSTGQRSSAQRGLLAACCERLERTSLLPGRMRRLFPGPSRTLQPPPRGTQCGRAEGSQFWSGACGGARPEPAGDKDRWVRARKRAAGRTVQGQGRMHPQHLLHAAWIHALRPGLVFPDGIPAFRGTKRPSTAFSPLTAPTWWICHGVITSSNFQQLWKPGARPNFSLTLPSLSITNAAGRAVSTHSPGSQALGRLCPPGLSKQD